MEAFPSRALVSNLVLADTALATYNGHYFNYDLRIRDHARSLGVPVQVLARATADTTLIAELDAIPCFRRDHADPDAGRATLADLRAVQSRLDLGPRTLVLFHTLLHHQVEPVVRWVEGMPESRRPWVALLFRFTSHPHPHHPDRAQEGYRRAFADLERSTCVARFRLLTDSELLRAEYGGYTRLPVYVVPIPHAAPEDISPHHEGEGITISYLGNARSSKGFDLLPDAFRRLRPALEQGRVRGEVQANLRFGGDWPLEVAAGQLERLGVRLHRQELTADGYAGLLGRAGIVLLPYTLDHYHSQTSGIFCEALAHGKPVVVPRGTWMASQLRAHGAGVTFLPGDRLSLAEAVESAVERYPELRAEARSKVPAWSRLHCPQSFLEALFATVGPAQTNRGEPG